MKGWLDGRGGNAERESRWLTPRKYVEALGDFDLDPCGAPGHDLAAETYTPEKGMDGLTLPWRGLVWLNPPYGREAEPFLERMAQHQHGTALIFANTETRVWFEHVWPFASAILFLRGRVRFLDENQVEARTNSGKPSVLAAYGEADADALEMALSLGDLDGRLVRL